MRFDRTPRSYFVLILLFSLAPFFCRAQDFHGSLIGTVKDFSAKELEGIATVTPAVDLAEIQDVFVIIRQK